MEKPDTELLNAWFSKQYFVWDDTSSHDGNALVKWSDELKHKLELKHEAIAWETHKKINGYPFLIYHDLEVYNILGKTLIWVNLGIEVKVSPFGLSEFYTDTTISFTDLLAAFNKIFNEFSPDENKLYLEYTYLAFDFINENDAISSSSSIAKTLGRLPVANHSRFNHGHIFKLGTKKPPISRLLSADLGSEDLDSATHFIYPEAFIIHATPRSMDYHDSAQEVVYYHRLIRYLGVASATYMLLNNLDKRTGARIKPLLRGLEANDTFALALVRSVQTKQSGLPLSIIKSLAEIVNRIHPDSIQNDWKSLELAWLYPVSLMRNFINQLSILRSIYNSNVLINSEFVAQKDSTPVCHALGQYIFPGCPSGIYILNQFAHLSSLIFTNIRRITKEEDFKNLVLAVLAGYNSRLCAEKHHGNGIPDIIVSCGERDVVVECKIWRYPRQIYKDIEQVTRYVGSNQFCGILVYLIQDKPSHPILPEELERRRLGSDSVASPFDCIIDTENPNHNQRVPIAVLFFMCPSESVQRGSLE